MCNKFLIFLGILFLFSLTLISAGEIGLPETPGVIWTNSDSDIKPENSAYPSVEQWNAVFSSGFSSAVSRLDLDSQIKYINHTYYVSERIPGTRRYADVLKWIELPYGFFGVSPTSTIDYAVLNFTGQNYNFKLLANNYTMPNSHIELAGFVCSDGATYPWSGPQKPCLNGPLGLNLSMRYVRCEQENVRSCVNDMQYNYCSQGSFKNDSCEKNEYCFNGDCILNETLASTCGGKNGFICSENQYCEGSDVIASDSDRCCSQSCSTPGQIKTCSQCGNGLFNLCDKTECENSLNEWCVFNSGFLGLGGSCGNSNSQNLDEGKQICKNGECRNVEKINECKVLDDATKYYLLEKDINSFKGTCFDVAVDDVIFDMDGKTILGSPPTFNILNCNDLQNMKNNLNGDYFLMNDIDCSDTQNWNNGAGFEPIGNEVNGFEFTGTLEGNGHVISDLYIYRPSLNSVGLFGQIISGGSVNRVGLERVNITGGEAVGSLVGALVHSNSFVNNSYSNGIVGGSDVVGGLIGYAEDSLISNSYSIAEVSSSASASYRGGLVGMTYHSALISNSFSAGVVNRAGRRGALIGILYVGRGAVVRNSYVFVNDSNLMSCVWIYGSNNPDAGYPGCIKVNATESPNYFKDSFNQPISSWDLTNVWAVRPGINGEDPYLIWQNEIDDGGSLGIYSAGKNNLIVKNGTITGFSVHGLYLSNVINSNFEELTIFNNTNGIALSGSSANQFENFSAYDNVANDLMIEGSSNGNSFANYNFNKYLFSSPINLDVENEFVQIDFISGISGSGNNFMEAVQLSENSIFVDSENNPGLNRSARLTFLDVVVPEGKTVDDIIIYKDGVKMYPRPNVSLKGNVISFDVNGFSQYSTGFRGDCGNGVLDATKDKVEKCDFGGPEKGSYNLEGEIDWPSFKPFCHNPDEGEASCQWDCSSCSTKIIPSLSEYSDINNKCWCDCNNNLGCLSDGNQFTLGFGGNIQAEIEGKVVSGINVKCGVDLDLSFDVSSDGGSVSDEDLTGSVEIVYSLVDYSENVLERSSVKTYSINSDNFATGNLVISAENTFSKTLTKDSASVYCLIDSTIKVKDIDPYNISGATNWLDYDLDSIRKEDGDCADWPYGNEKDAAVTANWASAQKNGSASGEWKESLCFFDSENDGVGDNAGAAFCRNPLQEERVDDVDNNCQGTCQGDVDRTCTVLDYVGDGKNNQTSVIVSADPLVMAGCGEVYNSYNQKDEFCQMVDDSVAVDDGIICDGYNRAVKWIETNRDTEKVSVGSEYVEHSEYFKSFVHTFVPGGVSGNGFAKCSGGIVYEADKDHGYNPLNPFGPLFNPALNGDKLSNYPGYYIDGLKFYGAYPVAECLPDGEAFAKSKGTTDLPEEFIDSFRGELNFSKFYGAAGTAGALKAKDDEGNLVNSWKTACVQKDKCADGVNSEGAKNLFETVPYKWFTPNYDTIYKDFDSGKSVKEKLEKNVFVPVRLVDSDTSSCKFENSQSLDNEVSRGIPPKYSSSDYKKSSITDKPYCSDDDGDGFCGCPASATITVCPGQISGLSFIDIANSNLGKVGIGECYMACNYTLATKEGYFISNVFPDCDNSFSSDDVQYKVALPDNGGFIQAHTNPNLGWPASEAGKSYSAWNVHPFAPKTIATCGYGFDVDCNQNYVEGVYSKLLSGKTPFDMNVQTGTEKNDPEADAGYVGNTARDLSCYQVPVKKQLLQDYMTSIDKASGGLGLVTLSVVVLGYFLPPVAVVGLWADIGASMSIVLATDAVFSVVGASGYVTDLSTEIYRLATQPAVSLKESGGVLAKDVLMTATYGFSFYQSARTLGTIKTYKNPTGKVASSYESQKPRTDANVRAEVVEVKTAATPKTGCFLENTSVTLADGSLANIEDLQAGKSVVAYDLEKEESVIAKITKFFIRNETKYRVVEYE